MPSSGLAKFGCIASTTIDQTSWAISTPTATRPTTVSIWNRSCISLTTSRVDDDASVKPT